MSIIRPRKKLAINNPDLLPFTGYNIIKSRYGNGLI
jgi:hypothetical protein